MGGKQTAKRRLKGCGCVVGVWVGLFLLGLAVAVFEPPIESALHKRKMRRQFREPFAAPGHYEPMPYAELAAVISPGFTAGDAVGRFGMPRRILRGYRSPLDEFRYDWMSWRDGEGAERELVTGFVLVFEDFVLKAWWPTEIAGEGIRDGFGLTQKGREAGAAEKWPVVAPGGRDWVEIPAE